MQIKELFEVYRPSAKSDAEYHGAHDQPQGFNRWVKDIRTAYPNFDELGNIENDGPGQWRAYLNVNGKDKRVGKYSYTRGGEVE